MPLTHYFFVVKSKELEELIALTLVDENLSVKEREVLRNKAIKMGFDVEELDIIIDARLYELNKKNGKAQVKDEPACPGCGEKLIDDPDTCPSCTYTLKATPYKDRRFVLEEAEHQLYASDEENTVLVKSMGNAIKNQLLAEYNYNRAAGVWIMIICTGGLYIVYKKLIKKEPLFGMSALISYEVETTAGKINYRWRNNPEIVKITTEAVVNSKKIQDRYYRNQAFNSFTILALAALFVYWAFFSESMHGIYTGYPEIDAALKTNQVHKAWALYDKLPANEKLESVYHIINEKHTDSLLDAGNYTQALQRANVQPDFLAEFRRHELIDKVLKKMVPELLKNGETQKAAVLLYEGSSELQKELSGKDEALKKELEEVIKKQEATTATESL